MKIRLVDRGLQLIGNSHDQSILLGLVYVTQEEGSFSERIMSRAADFSSFATQRALTMITSADDSEWYWEEISKALKTLQQEVFDQAENEILLDCFSQRDLSQICISVPRLVLLLMEADPFSIDNKFITYRVRFLLYLGQYSHYDDEDTVKMLSTFVKGGANVNYAVIGQFETLSMTARARQTWNIWCEALKNSGNNIEDVVSKEGNSWLLGDDWKEVWREHMYGGYDDILSDASDGDSSEESDYDGYEEVDSDENDHQPYKRMDRGDDDHTSEDKQQIGGYDGRQPASHQPHEITYSQHESFNGLHISRHTRRITYIKSSGHA